MVTECGSKDRKENIREAFVSISMILFIFLIQYGSGNVFYRHSSFLRPDQEIEIEKEVGVLCDLLHPWGLTS